MSGNIKFRFLLALIVVALLFVVTSAAVAEEQSKVFDDFAGEMLETIDPNVKVAIQPFNSKKVDLPEKITTGFNNRLVDSLLKKSNFKINIIERAKLEDIWKEAELFGYEKGAFTGASQAKPGYLERASEGTLFLDEIGELPLEVQVKLLRVIQEKEIVRVGSTKPRSINFRVISATNKNLIHEASAGNFREDLFYRIGVGILNIPPLRDREGDIGLLIDKLMEKINGESVNQPGYEKRKLAAGAKSALTCHDWPGNVRELRNTLTAVTVFSPTATIRKNDVENHIHVIPGKESHDILKRVLGEGFNMENITQEVAKHYIEKALKETGGHKSRAAELLGFSNHQTLTNWMARCGLNL